MTPWAHLVFLACCGVAGGWVLAAHTAPADACSCIPAARRFLELAAPAETTSPWPREIVLTPEAHAQVITGAPIHGEPNDGDTVIVDGFWLELKPEGAP